MDFLAIDFETANSARSSPCAIGLTVVEGGRVTETQSQIIRPSEGFDYLDPYNEMIHGITDAQIEAAPDFEQIWAGVARDIEGKVIVAHNAAFDTGVLRDTLDVIGAPWPNVDYVCTMVLSRRVLSLDSYRLPYVTESLGVTFDDHHDAGADSRAAAEVLLRLSDMQSASDLDALLGSVGVRRGLIRSDSWRGCTRLSTGGGSGARPVIGEVNENADPDHPLYGLNVCFTGALQTMTRQDAWDRLCDVGGSPEKGVTKQTNILVVGAQDPRALRPGATRSSKEEKASALRASGQAIEVMGEDDFIALVGDIASEGERGLPAT